MMNIPEPKPRAVPMAVTVGVTARSATKARAVVARILAGGLIIQVCISRQRLLAMVK
jgi:hypothetical protein